MACSLSKSVIPAKAGIQCRSRKSKSLDSRLRGDDGDGEQDLGYCTQTSTPPPHQARARCPARTILRNAFSPSNNTMHASAAAAATPNSPADGTLK